MFDRLRAAGVDYCVACGEVIDLNRVWLLCDGGHPAHLECEDAAVRIHPNPRIDGMEVRPMRMHPPLYSTLEIPSFPDDERHARARAAVDVMRPWKRR